MKKICFDESEKKYYYGCLHSEMFYKQHGVYENELYSLRSVSKVCESDPSVYQACGFSTDIHSNTNSNHSNTSISADSGGLCGGHFDINSEKQNYTFIRVNTSSSEQEEETPSQDSREIMMSTPYSLCDGDCGDMRTCVDESFCNGYHYGVWCKGRNKNETKYVSVDNICGGSTYCVGLEDELNCNVTDSEPASSSCILYSPKLWRLEEITARIFNYTRCSVFDVTARNFPYCFDYRDQTNCSDTARIGGYCKVGGYMSSVSRYVVCDDPQRKTPHSVSLCDDHLEDECRSPSASCQVHKHKWCDGVNDCPDGSDEVHDVCNTMTTRETDQCARSFGNGDVMGIPISWIMDDQTDCLNGKDEQLEHWEFCGNKTDRTHRVKLGGESCENVFLCPGSSSEKPYVIFDLLCDGVESCGMENEVCQISRGFPSKNTTIPLEGKVRDICRAFSDLDCGVRNFEKPYGDVFGVTTLVNVPNSKVNCSELFGEYYVYLSCMGLCLDSTCPLNTAPLTYDACPGQYPDRVYTLANNSFLSFVTESENDDYGNDYFQCRNSKCIKYSQVCDLVNDCGDSSDEEHCSNQWMCANTDSKQIVSLSQKCDGIYDCFDLSDECNPSCGKEILGNPVLKCTCWLMGVLAVVFNSVMVLKAAVTLKESRSSSMLYTKALIGLVGLGDLMIGVYLVALSIYDSFIYAKDFCRSQAEWLSSYDCKLLGVISTSASQLSLFAMTTLSFIRMMGVFKNSLTAPAPVGKRVVLKTICMVLAIVSVSVAVAAVPLVPYLEDYFVQGIFYNPEYKMFVGFPNKVKHVDILQAYFNNTSNITVDMSWQEIGSKIDSMFTQTQRYGTLTRTPVHFYGNDGVCLFKYFVRNNDPTRVKQGADAIDHRGNIVVWVMLTLNLVCFAVITVSYILITRTAEQSSVRTGQDRNADVVQQNKKLQRKVFIIITTDFFCWVPFIMICALHSLKVLDATSWYASFAMTVLPLNSVINPLLYDNTIEQFLRRCCRRLGFQRMVGSIRQSLHKGSLLLREKPITEVVELGRLETSETNDPPCDRVSFPPCEKETSA